MSPNRSFRPHRPAGSADSIRPLAPHVQGAIQASFATGAARRPAPAGLAAIAQRKAVEAGGPLAPHVRAMVQAVRGPRALQPVRYAPATPAPSRSGRVVQKADEQVPKIEVTSTVSTAGPFVRRPDTYTSGGLKVKQGEGVQGINFTGVWTDQVRPCFILCLFGGSTPVAPVYMHHTSFADDLLGAGRDKLEKWKKEPPMGFESEKVKSYVIGGDRTQVWDEAKNEEYGELNIQGVHSPLSTEDREFGCVEAKNGQVSYWFEYSS